MPKKISLKKGDPSGANPDEACDAIQSLSLKEGSFPYALGWVFDRNVFPLLSASDLASLSLVCRQTNSWTIQEREKRAASALLLHAVKANETEAKRLLEFNPYILYSKKGVVTDLSDRRIQGLTLFQVALCVGDVEMCEMIKEYFIQLENGENELKKQFNEIFPVGFEAHDKMQQDDVFDFKEIRQAIIYASNVEVTAALNKEFNKDYHLHQSLEKFKQEFTEVSSKIVFNPYHLLRAFQIYNMEFENFYTWDKRNLFWRQVIGYVQRYLPACYGQAFAQGIYNIIHKKEPLKRSFVFRNFSDGLLFPLTPLGLGTDFAIAEFGTSSSCQWTAPYSNFATIISNKNAGFEKIIAPTMVLHVPLKSRS